MADDRVDAGDAAAGTDDGDETSLPISGAR